MVTGRRRREEGATDDRWQMTYCSVVIILISIFMMIISYSTIEGGKMTGFLKRMGRNPSPADIGGPQEAASGNPDEARLDAALASMQQMIAERAPEDQAATARTRSGFRVVFAEKSFFTGAPKKPKMTEESRPLLDGMAQVIRATALRVGVAVMAVRPPAGEGAGPVLENSAARANLILRYLAEKGGIPVGRLAAAGFANLPPAMSSGSGETRGPGRVEFFFEAGR